MSDFYISPKAAFDATADAIRAKLNSQTDIEWTVEGFADAIGDIQTGGGSAVVQPLSVTENGVYTAPSGVDGYSPVTVNVQGGEEVVPDDGKTRIWIHIGEDTPENRSTFYLRFTASTANNTTIDWGDGTTETKGSTSATSYSHRYPQGGDYVITLTVNSGTINFMGSSGTGGYSIYGSRSDLYCHNRERIKKVIIGNNVLRIGDYAFYYCCGLQSITMSDDITIIGQSAFQYCYNLVKITISKEVTTLSSNAFNSCWGLTSITIPPDVTSISSNVFALCYGMGEYHFQSTTPPTLSNSNAFSNISSDCIIYVPYSEDHSILNAYKTATNWSSRASQMQEEPA